MESGVWNWLPRCRFDLLRLDHHRAGNNTFRNSSFALLRYRNEGDTRHLV